MYTAGDSGKGICRACVEQRDCDVVRARKASMEPSFDLNSDDRPPAPARSLPVPAAPLTARAASPAPAPQTPKPLSPNLEAVIQRLLQLRPGETVTLAVPGSMTAQRFEAGLLRVLSEREDTRDVRWVHHLDESGHRLIIGTERSRLNSAKTAARAQNQPGRKPHKWDSVIDQVLQLKPSEKISLSVPATNGPTHYAGLVRSMLHLNVRTKGNCWSVTQAEDPDVKEIVVTRDPRREEKPTATPFVSAQSPVAQGKRAAYRISDEVRAKIIAEPAERHYGDVAKQYGVSVTSVDNIRRAAHVPALARGWQAKRKAVKYQLEPAIKQAPAPLEASAPLRIDPSPKPDVIPGLFLSRAFELVIAEMQEGIDRMSGDKDKDARECVKAWQEVVGQLRDFHPAISGGSWLNGGPSIYDKARERAEAELRVIGMEIPRLQARQKALQAILAPLKANAEAERDTR
jgi:hypothetical protein